MEANKLSDIYGDGNKRKLTNLNISLRLVECNFEIELIFNKNRLIYIYSSLVNIRSAI